MQKRPIKFIFANSLRQKELDVSGTYVISLFCKRALSKTLYSAKETYIFMEPTNRSHPIAKSSMFLAHMYIYIYSHYFETNFLLLGFVLYIYIPIIYICSHYLETNFLLLEFVLYIHIPIIYICSHYFEANFLFWDLC